jgi:hypothetical protein
METKTVDELINELCVPKENVVRVFLPSEIKKVAEAYHAQFGFRKFSEENKPELYGRILFVVKSREKFYNGKAFGGTYQGNEFGYYACSCPGIEFEGTHWAPFPEFPKD